MVVASVYGRSPILWGLQQVVGDGLFELELRPIHVCLAERIRAHALVVMLAYRMAKELSRRWATANLKIQEGDVTLLLTTGSAGSLPSWPCVLLSQHAEHPHPDGRKKYVKHRCDELRMALFRQEGLRRRHQIGEQVADDDGGTEMVAH